VGNYGLRDFWKFDGLCSAVDMRLHPGNIYGGSSSRTPAWSLLGQSSAVTSMIKQKHCRSLYGDLLQSKL
jgi:hypothetical protein